MSKNNWDELFETINNTSVRLQKNLFRCEQINASTATNPTLEAEKRALEQQITSDREILKDLGEKHKKALFREQWAADAPSAVQERGKKAAKRKKAAMKASRKALQEAGPPPVMMEKVVEEATNS